MQDRCPLAGEIKINHKYLDKDIAPKTAKRLVRWKRAVETWVAAEERRGRVDEAVAEDGGKKARLERRCARRHC